MGMNQAGFTNYYLNTTRVGTKKDLDYMYQAWFKIHNWGFGYCSPWQATNPEYRMPKCCVRLKTVMISMGCDAKAATRVITAFKKWYKDTYPNG